MSGVGRVARGAAGVAVLILLLVLVNGWWRDYRRGEAPVSPQAEATSTPQPSPESEQPPAEGAEQPTGQEAGSSGATVVVLIEGLNFRKEPSREGELIRGLGKGTQLVYLETVDGWYRVRSEDGTEGYVSASPQYTEVRQ